MWFTQKVLLYQPLQKINTLLVAYDQVIGGSEDNFQREIYTIAKDFGMEISPEIYDTIAFLGQDPVRCKITVNNKCLHQVMSFKYLICESSFENETEIVKEWKEEPVDTKLRKYKSNWLQHVTRMNNNRMPKITLSYRPNGQRQLGRRLKRLLDEAKTGLLWPNLWWMMMVMYSFSVSMTCESSSKYGWSNNREVLLLIAILHIKHFF